MNHSLYSLTCADSNNWILYSLNGSLIETIFVIALQKQTTGSLMAIPSNTSNSWAWLTGPWCCGWTCTTRGFEPPTSATTTCCLFWGSNIGLAGCRMQDGTENQAGMQDTKQIRGRIRMKSSSQDLDIWFSMVKMISEEWWITIIYMTGSIAYAFLVYWRHKVNDLLVWYTELT